MSELSFKCFERDGNGRKQFYTVVAEQTHRPLVYRQSVIGSQLAWQFFNETLGLVLLRRSDNEYVSIDDPDRVFESDDANQPAFEEPDCVPVNICGAVAIG